MTPPENTLPLPFKVCQKGLHVYDRSIPLCPECLKANKDKHYAKNKEKMIAKEREKRLKDPETYRRKMREYQDKNRESLRQKSKERYAANIERRRKEARDYAREHSEYGIWKMMLVRCSNPNSKAYPDYGGRGIRVCARWQGKNGYANFLADVKKRPSRYHQLNRIDNNGNYEPDNVNWATRREQCRNRRNNYMVTCWGETLCLAEWSERTGLGAALIRDRLEIMKWSPERALTEPMKIIKRVQRPITLTHNEKTMGVGDWAREIGIRKGTLRRRLALGWDIDEALTKPLLTAEV